MNFLRMQLFNIEFKGGSDLAEHIINTERNLQPK